MSNNISQSRMQVITNNLFAELKKAELIKDSDTLDLSSTSEQSAYKMAKPFFNLMTENLSNHITEEQMFADIRKYDTEDEWTYWCDDEALRGNVTYFLQRNKFFEEKFKK